MADVPDDALLGVAPGRRVRVGHVDPAGDIHLAERGIPVERGRRGPQVALVEVDLPGEGLGRRERGEHEPEAVARRVAQGAVGGTGHEERRMRRLHAHREDLVVALDHRAEARALVPDAPLVEELEDEVDGLFLDVPPAVEISAEAVELVRAVARAQAQHHPAAREDVHEGHVLDHPDGIVERHRDHRAAEADARGPGRQVAHVAEHVG